jgi:hypothetical protein
LRSLARRPRRRGDQGPVERGGGGEEGLRSVFLVDAVEVLVEEVGEALVREGADAVDLVAGLAEGGGEEAGVAAAVVAECEVVHGHEERGDQEGDEGLCGVGEGGEGRGVGGLRPGILSCVCRVIVCSLRRRR